MKTHIRAGHTDGDHLFTVEARDQQEAMKYWRSMFTAKGYTNPTVIGSGEDFRHEVRSATDHYADNTVMSLSDLRKRPARCTSCGINTIGPADSASRYHRVGCSNRKSGDLVTTLSMKYAAN
jgi:hypothetical protein